MRTKLNTTSFGRDGGFFGDVVEATERGGGACRGHGRGRSDIPGVGVRAGRRAGTFVTVCAPKGAARYSTRSYRIRGSSVMRRLRLPSLPLLLP